MTTTFQVERNSASCRVSVNGALTAILVPELKDTLRRELQQHTQELVFDLQETTMLDSSGIGLLIASNNTVTQKGGRIRVMNPSAQIFKLLSSMRLAARFNIRPISE